MSNQDDKLDQILVRLPRGLKRKAKSQAVLQGKSLQAMINELLTQWLEKTTGRWTRKAQAGIEFPGRQNTRYTD